MIKLIEEKFPSVTEWTLDTSQKSIRNHHFYEKLGYIKEDEDEEERYYKKIIEGEKSIRREENKDLSKVEYANCNMRECDFYSLNLRKSVFNNVSISESKISNTLIQNATISNMNMCKTLFGNGKMDGCEICHVSLGDAYFHDTNLGWFHENKPMKFERCDLKGSKITNCDLSNCEMEACNINSMKIDGIYVEEMIEVYKKNIGKQM